MMTVGIAFVVVVVWPIDVASVERVAHDAGPFDIPVNP